MTRGRDAVHHRFLTAAEKVSGRGPSLQPQTLRLLPLLWHAAHLVDRVLPLVPARQFVVTLLVPLRLLLAARPCLLGPALHEV